MGAQVSAWFLLLSSARPVGPFLCVFLRLIHAPRAYPPPPPVRPADPLKNSVFRETRRAVQDAIDGGHLSPSNPMLHDFNRRILKCPEHK